LRDSDSFFENEVESDPEQSIGTLQPPRFLTRRLAHDGQR
jgi:hypothetical protein